MLWVGLAIVAVGLLIYVLTRKPSDYPGPGYMRVTCVDGHGRVMSREWVKLKEPDRFPTNGMTHLGPYVERVFASTADFTTLMFFTPDGERGGSLDKVDGGLNIGLIFQSRQNPEPEAKARAFFEARNAATKDDYLGKDMPIVGPTRILSWWVHGDESKITALCQDVLRELCGVQDEEALDITYEERERKLP